MPNRTSGGSPGCLVRMRSMYKSFRPSERKVADYCLAHPDEVIRLSVTELAKRSQTSDATVVKFSQKLGCSGYQELKIVLAQELSARPKHIYSEVEMTDDLETLKAKLFQIEERALQETETILDTRQLRRAVEAIHRAGTMQIYGVGNSGFVALDAQHKFLRIGKQCAAYTDPHLQIAFAALLGPGDVAMGISHSGATVDTVDALTTARQAGATTIALTSAMNSPITEVADISLFTAPTETAFRSGALASRLAQLLVVDILFIAVAQKDADNTLACLEKTRSAVANRRYDSAPLRSEVAEKG